MELEGEGEALPVPCGCVVLPNRTVGVVVGLQAAAQYNGELVRVVSYEDESGR